MAIKKVKTRKMELTVKSSIYFCVGAALFVFSVMIFMSAVNGFRYKWNLQDGIRNYSAGRIGSVIPMLETAADLEPDEPWALILYSTLRCNGGELAEAEKGYRRLLDAGHDLDPVHVGLGVVLLKKAFRTEGEEAFALLDKARASLRKAGSSSPDARVGLAHALLFEALRKEDAALFGQAKDEFLTLLDELKGSREKAALVSLPSVRDLYIGLARASFDASEYRPKAEEALISCQAIAPKWDFPKAGHLVLLSQKLVSIPMTQAELKEFDRGMYDFLQSVGSSYRSSEAMKELYRKPLMLYRISFAEAQVASGDWGGMNRTLANVRQEGKATGDLLPLKASAMIFQKYFTDDYESPVFQRQSSSYQSLLQQLLQSPALAKKPGADLKPVLYNNNGLVFVLQTKGRKRSERNSGADKAIAQLKNGLKFGEKDYWVLRNLAVLYHQKGDPRKASEFLQKAGESASAAKADQDFAAVKEYLGG